MLRPAGKGRAVGLRAPWRPPGFVGGPLPLSREASRAGFSGRWDVPYFGRGYAPRWTSVGLDPVQMRSRADASAVGVSLLQPIDIYQQAERAVKYAALFIVMTFVVFFLWEIVRSRLLHPIQYLFVGFAMCVFYLLLFSISYHTLFDFSHLSTPSSTSLPSPPRF